MKKEIITTIYTDIWDGSPRVFETKELVRCKDCKFYEEMGHFCKYDGLYKKNSWHQFGYACYDDWFCADGMKKNEIA